MARNEATTWMSSHACLVSPSAAGSSKARRPSGASHMAMPLAADTAQVAIIVMATTERR